jgi:hypothetical protein
MNYTFNASEIQCNGVGDYGYQAALKSKDLIESTILQVRSDLGLDEIWNRITTAHPNADYHQGSRFNDIDRLTARLATGLGNWAWNKFETEELVEMNVKHILETISYDDAITIVVEAHRDCADADHWYTFEKEW